VTYVPLQVEPLEGFYCSLRPQLPVMLRRLARGGIKARILYAVWSNARRVTVGNLTEYGDCFRQPRWSYGDWEKRMITIAGAMGTTPEQPQSGVTLITRRTPSEPQNGLSNVRAPGAVTHDLVCPKAEQRV
jgi:hypothetical protein